MDYPLNNYVRDLDITVENIRLSGFVSKSGIANFLGLPYARAPVRFRPSVILPIRELHSGVVARQYGHRCPQKLDPLQSTMSHVFEKVSAMTDLDETKCLNLNIYTPLEALDPTRKSKVPVLVWIHGGGFNIGDNTTQFGTLDMPKRQLQLLTEFSRW